MAAQTNDTLTCDVLVIGSGAGGLSAAITARKAGLDVLVIEKEEYFGGTTALSGGFLWVPGNHHAKEFGIADTKEAARTYLKGETGNSYRAEMTEAFLEEGPKMLDFFERETSEVRFLSSPQFPDYHPTAPGGVAGGRSVLAAPFDGTRLGKEFQRLRPPLRTITFVGMMFNSGNEVKHFFNATKSLSSAIYVAKRLTGHMKELLLYRRGTRLTSGNALAARLAKSAFDLGIPIRTRTKALSLITDAGKVTGAVLQTPEGRLTVTTRRGVVMAAGGFPQDPARHAKMFPHGRKGERHVSPAPEGNTGDGLSMLEAVGATIDDTLPNAAAWIPVSRVPLGKGKIGVFPHLIDRYKPGVIAVNRKGKRFVNESNSYHDVGVGMIETSRDEKEIAAWMICDHRALRKYGLGFAKPFPMPTSIYTGSGYLMKGKTLAELAKATGIDAAGLEATVKRYNENAKRGVDPDFHRGENVYNRYLGDPDAPNACIAPLDQGPWYAIRLHLGDLGTYAGIRTDARARVLDGEGQPIAGLYAVGNDMASLMGGNYPGAGITLGPIMTFGYIAGRDLAASA